MCRWLLPSVLLGAMHVFAAPEDKTVVGVWTAPEGTTQQPLWPKGAPDQLEVTVGPERVLTEVTPEALQGTTSQAVFDVSVPTLTLFPPRGVNSGAAVVVFPGGGFKALAITLEGTEVCEWIAAHGMTCALVKYRVPRTAHHYDETCYCSVTPKSPRALQDAQRAVRLVRSQAKSLGIDPAKVGVMGFSAGGYLVALLSNVFTPAYAPVDAVDRLSSRPDFAIPFFPGHLCRDGNVLDPTIRVTKQTPPTFLLQAWDDPVDPICNGSLYANALATAGVKAEVHFFARGGHAFALRPRQQRVDAWPGLLEGWLRELGMLAAADAGRLSASGSQ